MSYNFPGAIRFCPYCGQPIGERVVSGRAQPYCTACQATFFADPKLAVAVVIEQDGKVVLQRRTIDPGLGRWTFPSGYVDRGEHPEDAAVREAAEEVGVEVRLSRLVGLYGETGSPVVLAVYAAEMIAGRLAPADENDAVELFALDALPPLAFPHDRDIIATWANGGVAELGARAEAPAAPAEPHRH